MALRDQPYIPLYVQDYLTDEKLNECSAATQGVYIKILCVLHKSDEYGTILLKQKNKQNPKQINNFAYKLLKQLTFTEKEIVSALEELVSEKVLFIDGDKLFQKRMVKDNKLSIMRAEFGRRGGEKTHFAQAKPKARAQAKPKARAQAKPKANPEDEYEYENEIENVYKNNSLINKEEKKENNTPKKNNSTPSNKELAIALTCEYFLITELQNFQAFSLISNCMELIYKSGNIGLYTANIKAYHEYKILSKQERHSVNRFLGSPHGNCEDGAWCSQDWVKTLNRYKKLHTDPKDRKHESQMNLSNANKNT